MKTNNDTLKKKRLQEQVMKSFTAIAERLERSEKRNVELVEALEELNGLKPRHPSHPDSKFNDRAIYNKAYKKWMKINKLAQTNKQLK